MVAEVSEVQDPLCTVPLRSWPSGMARVLGWPQSALAPVRQSWAYARPGWANRSGSCGPYEGLLWTAGWTRASV